MTEENFKRPYLDSSVFIAALKEEAGRADTVKYILDAADKSQIQIVASTFVAAEVIKIRKQTEYLSHDEEVEIDAILNNGKILFVEVDLRVALEARKLARDHSLKPVDAVHLASALRAKADVLLRYDDGFNVPSGIEGMKVCEPFWYGSVPLL